MPLFGSNVDTRKEVLSGFKHDMFGRQHLNFERALDIFKRNVGTPLTVKNLPKPETAQKSLWIPGKLEASDLICVR